VLTYTGTFFGNYHEIQKNCSRADTVSLTSPRTYILVYVFTDFFSRRYCNGKALFDRFPCSRPPQGKRTPKGFAILGLMNFLKKRFLTFFDFSGFGPERGVTRTNREDPIFPKFEGSKIMPPFFSFIKTRSKSSKITNSMEFPNTDRKRCRKS